jgi:hypothetical protein
VPGLKRGVQRRDWAKLRLTQQCSDAAAGRCGVRVEANSGGALGLVGKAAAVHGC